MVFEFSRAAGANVLLCFAAADGFAGGSQEAEEVKYDGAVSGGGGPTSHTVSDGLNVKRE